MGLIRSGLILFASCILIISLLLTNIFLITSLSLDYETISPKLIKITTTIANNEADLTRKIETNYQLMLKDCENKTILELTNYSIPYNYSIPCEIINESQEKIINHTIKKIIEKAYYKDYDCKFSECIKNSPLYLTSNEYKDKLNSKFKKTLIFSLVLIIIIFILTEKKRNTLILTGISLILATLPLAKVNIPINILSKIIGLASKIRIMDNYLSELITLLFSKTWTVFNFNITIGTMLIVVGAGIGLIKFFLYGKEKKYTKSDIENIVEKKLAQKEKIKEKLMNIIKKKK